MQLTLSGFTALRVLRAMRRGMLGRGIARRCDLRVPEPPRKRWSKPALSRALEPVSPAVRFPSVDLLEVAVPTPESRIRTEGVRCVVHAKGLPRNAFLDIGSGIAVSSPELVLVELANRMRFSELVLLTMELCGSYGLSPEGDDARTGLDPLTSIDRTLDFLRKATDVWGLETMRLASTFALDDAWSPMEAILATMLVLPEEKFGYGMQPMVLNRREESCGRPTELGSRVPDIMFRGTSVGLNYDGEGHFGIGDVASATLEMLRNPGSLEAERSLAETLASMRGSIVGDKRRDRDLSVMGLSVLPVTKEDLYEQDALDRLVMQVIQLIEAEGTRSLDRQRRMLESRALKKGRALQLRSLLPGRASAGAGEALRSMEEGVGEPPQMAEILLMPGASHQINVQVI